MVSELKKFVDAGKVLFGIKQSVKNSGKIKRVYLPNDAREETIRTLKEKKIEFDFLDIPKKEVSQKLDLDFLCEVFSLRK